MAITANNDDFTTTENATIATVVSTNDSVDVGSLTFFLGVSVPL